MRRSLLSIITLAASTLAPTLCSAADKTPLAALPVLRSAPDATDEIAALPVAGLTVKQSADQGVELRATTAQGYCLAEHDAGMHLVSSSPSNEGELWRLTDDAGGGSAKLERTKFSVMVLSDRHLWVKSRTSIALRELARANGVTAWGFREPNGDVVVLARGATSGRESPPPHKKGELEVFHSVTSECAFGATVLHAASPGSGAVARLEGTQPARDGGANRRVVRWAVDSSLSRFARDPEPTLAVRVHELAPTMP